MGVDPRRMMAQQQQEQQGPGLPGEGFMFPGTLDQIKGELPDERTTPDEVRDHLLVSILYLSKIARMPYNREQPKEFGQTILQMAQAYLLLDPSVDGEGVPLMQPNPSDPSMPFVHKAYLPPAAQEIAEENKGKQEALTHSKGSKPTPKPRAAL